MPGFNLVRNAKVFFTSDVNASTGVITETALTAGGTQELSVMNGFSFSQNVDAQTITVSEAGDTPARGQRSFNSALQPVDFSFTTYIRPRGASAATVNADELCLWNALFASGKLKMDTLGTGTAGEATVTATGISRANTYTNTVTLTWASTNLTTPAFAAGDRINLAGITDTTAGNAYWNGSATIGTITGALATCTGMMVYMDIAPVGGTSPTGTTSTLQISKNSAVLRNPANADNGAYHALITAGLSNKNQLQKFGLVILIDQTTYLIDNCVLDQASIDFGLDSIAQIQWSGKGTILRSNSAASANGGSFSGTGVTGSYTTATANTSGVFLTNKLSTATLKSTFLGAGTGAKTYTVALTGGNLTISNNVNYIVPETLGVVNKPIGYFTGTRAISGNITAYLKTGGTNPTNTLLTDLIASTTTEVKYYMEIQLGGAANANKVEFEIPAVSLQVPTVEVQDVVSTTINFNAQGALMTDSRATGLADDALSYYDIEAANGLITRYFSNVA